MWRQTIILSYMWRQTIILSHMATNHHSQLCGDNATFSNPESLPVRRSQRGREKLITRLIREMISGILHKFGVWWYALVGVKEAVNFQGETKLPIAHLAIRLARGSKSDSKPCPK